MKFPFCIVRRSQLAQLATLRKQADAHSRELGWLGIKVQQADARASLLEVPMLEMQRRYAHWLTLDPAAIPEVADSTVLLEYSGCKSRREDRGMAVRHFTFSIGVPTTLCAEAAAVAVSEELRARAFDAICVAYRDWSALMGDTTADAASPTA